jgi:hypothetical protein
MTDLPPLFDPKAKGAFRPLPDDVLESLTPQRRELYENVADAAHNLEQAENDLRAATDTVTACVQQVRDAEAACAKNRMSFHDLWKQNFGRPRQQRAQTVESPAA